MKERLILCGGASFSEADEDNPNYLISRLNCNGPDANVNIQVQDIAKSVAFKG